MSKNDHTNSGIEFYVAGVQHRNPNDFIPKVKGNEEVFFELEPTNSFDPNAVKVLLDIDEDLIHIGYVPKKLSRDVTEFIISAISPVGEIVKFVPSAPPWNMFKIRIFDYAYRDFDNEDYQVTSDEEDD